MGRPGLNAGPGYKTFPPPSYLADSLRPSACRSSAGERPLNKGLYQRSTKSNFSLPRHVLTVTTHSRVSRQTTVWWDPQTHQSLGLAWATGLQGCISACYWKEFPFYEQMTHRQRLSKTVTMSGKRRISKDKSDKNRIKGQSRWLSS